MIICLGKASDVSTATASLLRLSAVTGEAAVRSAAGIGGVEVVDEARLGVVGLAGFDGSVVEASFGGKLEDGSLGGSGDVEGVLFCVGVVEEARFKSNAEEEASPGEGGEGGVKVPLVDGFSPS